MSEENKEILNEELTKETTETPEVQIEEQTETLDPVQLKDEEIAKLKIEIEDWKNSYLRKQADFQNFTKRREKELENLREFASEKIITKLLDGIDNLERAVQSSFKTKDFDSLIKGVELILGNLKDIIKSEGVEEIITENAEFDPHHHMAVMIAESEEHKSNQIISELQKGYKMKGKVIRPSMVKVCKNN